MKLHGWCHKCKRIRRVNVTVLRTRGVQVGICDECWEAKRG